MKKIYLTMVLCLFAIGGWAQEETIGNGVNSDEYKSATLEYFDITEEEWEEIGYDAGESLDFEFLDDTLHVTGYLDLNCYNYQIGCIIHDDGKIDVKVYPINVSEDEDQPDCMVLRRAEAKIPGFKEGTYQIAFGGQAPVEIVCKGEKIEDYHPFIESNKKWHILRMSFGGFAMPRDNYFSGDERIEANGKTYQIMYEARDGDVREAALLREEGRRVYIYHANTNTEEILYDFTLNEGDTFELQYEGGLQCKVTKVHQIEVNGEKLKTITFEYSYMSEERKEMYEELKEMYGDFEEEKTPTWVWIEGIGNDDPLSYPSDPYAASSLYDQLCYAVSDNYYYPFSFNDVWVGWRGRPLLKGEDHTAEVPEERWGHDDLHYEFLPGEPWGYDKDTLHVYGNMWVACGGDAYIYCKEDNNHDIKLEIEYASEATPCLGFFSVDLYFPFFSATSGIQYTVTDSEGTHKVGIKGTEIADYRPFIEEGKEWIVKCSVGGSYYLVHYAFSDDAEFVSVEGKPCKKLIKRYDFSPMDKAGIGHPAIYGGETGFIYEEGKRVYFAVRGEEKLNLLYDFGAEVGDTINVYSTQENAIGAYIVEDKKKEESDCYKGICTQVRKDPGLLAVIYNLTDTWMEGVGGNRAPLENVDYGYLEGNLTVLMACTVGDEVIYKHPDWNFNEDAEGKKRIDFTHVVKTNPKGPQRKADGIPEEAVSGEYSSTALTIDLGTLRDAYAVTITDPSGQAVYTKSVKTNDVLALNIDISDYTTKGEYTITLENDQEVFTGILTRSEGVSIESLPTPQPAAASVWYDLTGRPVTHPTRGIYIKNHQKVYIK
ncbi:MAG: DUF3244 domain-containing protein [Bacteroidaceae bacterium]|nr:DUF3244 domain-containing protein [Bacteroidaceae bacterium]